MKILIDLSKDKYEEIMSMDWVNCRRFFDEEIRAIHDGKVLEQESMSELNVLDEYGNYKYPSDIELAEPNMAMSISCGDTISRILKRMWNCRGKHTTSIDKVKMEQIIRDEVQNDT